MNIKEIQNYPELTMTEKDGVITFHGKTDFEFGGYEIEEWCEHLVQGMLLGLETKEVGCFAFILEVCEEIKAKPKPGCIKTFLSLLPKEYHEDIEWAEQTENFGKYNLSKLLET